MFLNWFFFFFVQVLSVDGYKNFQLISDLEPEVEWLFAVSAENDIGFGDRAVTSKPVRLDKPISEYIGYTFIFYNKTDLDIFVINSVNDIQITTVKLFYCFILWNKICY